MFEVFFVYFIVTFFVYAVLYPLYSYEITQRLQFRFGIDGLMLCAVKATHWAFSMQIDVSFNSFVSAVVCSVVFFGFQRYVDLRIHDKPQALALRLWSMSYYSLATIVDSWVHLSIFNFCASRTDSALFIGMGNVLGHTIGLMVTYPVTAMQRGRKIVWREFLIYYARSSIAAFVIGLGASFFID